MMNKEFRDWLEEKKRDSTYSYLNNGMLINPNPDLEKELELVIKKYDELHKPAVLSQEWIINNQERKGVHFFVDVIKLQNLLVPKQELPAIPKYVADWIVNTKYNSETNIRVSLNNVPSKVNSWLWEDNAESNFDIYARAWLDGYEVEEEPLYYVINNENYFLLAKDKGHGFVFSTGGNSKLGNTDNISATFKLTEQEIKDYDPRYWAFRKPIDKTVNG